MLKKKRTKDVIYSQDAELSSVQPEKSSLKSSTSPLLPCFCSLESKELGTPLVMSTGMRVTPMDASFDLFLKIFHRSFMRTINGMARGGVVPRMARLKAIYIEVPSVMAFCIRNIFSRSPSDSAIG